MPRLIGPRWRGKEREKTPGVASATSQLTKSLPSLPFLAIFNKSTPRLIIAPYLAKLSWVFFEFLGQEKGSRLERVDDTVGVASL